VKKISPRQTTIIAASCLAIILITQIFLVHDYIRTTRNGFVRESDAIMEDAFKKDLEIRQKIYHVKDSIISYSKASEHVITTPVRYDFRKYKEYSNNEVGIVELAVNMTISQQVPIQCHQLDSVTGSILRERKINSNYKVDIIRTSDNKVLKSSKEKWPGFGIFQIRSKIIVTDIVRKEGLRLTLENPFGIIMKRMILMLTSSLIFSILCLLAFRYLLQVLARQKQLVAFKNEFLSTIAHELKRPVASIGLNLDALSSLGSKAKPGFIEQIIDRSVNATTELDDSITRIINLSKAEEGLLVLNVSTVNIETLLEEQRQRVELNHIKKVNTSLHLNTDNTELKADEQLLKQCFANLTDNSIKYSGETVDITYTVRRENDYLVVDVKDNGLGIPKDKLQNIFEKYNRAHTEYKIYGYGIGLNYVKTIVEKHGGTISVKSKEGEGSEFTVRLPAK